MRLWQLNHLWHSNRGTADETRKRGPQARPDRADRGEKADGAAGRPNGLEGGGRGKGRFTSDGETGGRGGGRSRPDGHAAGDRGKGFGDAGRPKGEGKAEGRASSKKVGYAENWDQVCTEANGVSIRLRCPWGL